mgnify:CR=1 FL=1
MAETGVKFDPDQHQAMMLEPSTTAEAGSVLRVLQKGYRLNDRLVRPAMVVVARAPDLVIASWCGKHVRTERIAARPAFQKAVSWPDESGGGYEEVGLSAQKVG